MRNVVQLFLTANTILLMRKWNHACSLLVYVTSVITPCWKLMLSEGWKCYFRDPYISKSSGEACPRTPPATQAFGTRHCPPPPNKSNLPTALHYQVTIERKMKRNKNRIAYKFCPEVLIKVFADTYLNLMLKTPKLLKVHCFQQNGLCRAVVIP